MSPRILPMTWPDGAPRLSMIAKRAYRMERARLALISEDLPLAEEIELVPSPAGMDGARLCLDTDLVAPLKPWTDVLLRGHAHSLRGPLRVLDTSLSVGPLRKNVRVWGRRRLASGLGARPTFTDPEPFRAGPLCWEHAYGGHAQSADRLDVRPLRPWRRGGRDRDGTEDRAGLHAYPRNPFGRGYFLYASRAEADGAELPTLEDPSDPITPDRLFARDALDWPDRPAAASYEPLDLWAFPRIAFWLGVALGPSHNALYEVRCGAISEADLSRPLHGAALDQRTYSCAPPGLSGARLRGGEHVTLRNLHPRSEVVEFDLPSQRPRFVLEPPGCGPMAMESCLATVLIEPDEDRVTLTWAGSMEVAAPYSIEMCTTMRRAAQWIHG